MSGESREPRNHLLFQTNDEHFDTVEGVEIDKRMSVEVEGKESSDVMNQFVTYIWEHPLLTNETREKRESAFRLMQEKFKDAKDMVFVPVGSCIWIMDNTSDVDYCLMWKHGGDYEKVKDARKNIALENKQSGKDGLKIEIANDLDVNQNDLREDFRTVALLFVTPDEYLAGDVAWARQLRKDIFDRKRFQDEASYYKFLEQFFNYLKGSILDTIRNWPNQGQAFSKRTARFFPALAERASQTGAPKMWAKKFYENLQDLMPPDVNMLQAGTIFSQGEIHIEERYVAKGIE